jgi:hypothetical protein
MAKFNQLESDLVVPSTSQFTELWRTSVAIILFSSAYAPGEEANTTAQWNQRETRESFFLIPYYWHTVSFTVGHKVFFSKVYLRNVYGRQQTCIYCLLRCTFHSQSGCPN